MKVNLVYLVILETPEGRDHKGQEAEREHQAVLDKKV